MMLQRYTAVFGHLAYSLGEYQTAMLDFAEKTDGNEADRTAEGFAKMFGSYFPPEFSITEGNAWMSTLNNSVQYVSVIRPGEKVADLPTGAVQLVPRCIAATVFGVPCVGGQKPLAADFAFLWCMTNTQALKEIRPEHPYKGYIVHPLDQLRNFFAGTDDRYILNGIIQSRHPGIALRDRELRRKIVAEHFCKTLCGAFCFIAV